MIKCNLAVLLAERELKISDIAEATGISRTTLTALYYNQGKGVQFETMDTLCEYFRVTPGQLFTYLNFDVALMSVTESEEGVFEYLFEFTIGDESFTENVDIIFYKKNGDDKLNVDITMDKQTYEKLKFVPKLYLQYELAKLLMPYTDQLEESKNGINAMLIIE